MSEWCTGEAWFDDNDKKYRCPVCNKRLKPMDVIGRFSGEFVGYKLPPHKVKGHKIKKLKSRSSKRRS